MTLDKTGENNTSPNEKNDQPLTSGRTRRRATRNFEDPVAEDPVAEATVAQGEDSTQVAAAIVAEEASAVASPFASLFSAVNALIGTPVAATSIQGSAPTSINPFLAPEIPNRVELDTTAKLVELDTVSEKIQTSLIFKAPDPIAVRPVSVRTQKPVPPVAETVESQNQKGAAAGVGNQSEPVASESNTVETQNDSDTEETETASSRRRRRSRGRRGKDNTDTDAGAVDPANNEPSLATEDQDDQRTPDSEASPQDEDSPVTARRRRRRAVRPNANEGISAIETLGRSSTRLEAKRQRRREERENGRRRIITQAEFLARRESVERSMIVREKNGRTQIAILEDGILVEHYVSQSSTVSMAGDVYLGKVQNVLPSMEAAFVDIGKGRNAVLYAGEVNWDAAGLEGRPRRIEAALRSGDSVLVQVTKDPIGQKGARLTSQVTLAGRYLVYVPAGGITGISKKLPEAERIRLKKLMREIVPADAGVIVRTAAEGASEEELRADISRLQAKWEQINQKSKSVSAPALLLGEPDLAIRVVRDIFNDDFKSLVVSGEQAWHDVSQYVQDLAPDLVERVSHWDKEEDIFAQYRIDEQLAKGMDRKVYLPSGGYLVIDRTEAMTVVDVNTGKYTGSGGTLEETVTKNNLESAEEIVRQLRLRDIGGIIVIDFIDMVLESNRDLVLRRLVECLGRDRTKHQVAEVTSLGLVQMTRKRVGQGLVEAFSQTCFKCHGRGFIVHTEPVGKATEASGHNHPIVEEKPEVQVVQPTSDPEFKNTIATIAKAAAHAHEVHEVEVIPEVHPDAGAEVFDEGETPTEVNEGTTESVPTSPPPTIIKEPLNRPERHPGAAFGLFPAPDGSGAEE